MESQLMDIQKINFDLSVMTINEPERTAKILGGIDSEGNLEYLVNRSAMLIGQARSEGKLNPSLPLEDIISYIAAAYSGIQMTCIIGACYRSSPMGGYEPRKLFKVLAQSIKSLLCQ